MVGVKLYLHCIMYIIYKSDAKFFFFSISPACKEKRLVCALPTIDLFSPTKQYSRRNPLYQTHFQEVGCLVPLRSVFYLLATAVKVAMQFIEKKKSKKTKQSITQQELTCFTPIGMKCVNICSALCYLIFFDYFSINLWILAITVCGHPPIN